MRLQQKHQLVVVVVGIDIVVIISLCYLHFNWNARPCVRPMIGLGWCWCRTWGITSVFEGSAMNSCRSMQCVLQSPACVCLCVPDRHTSTHRCLLLRFQITRILVSLGLALSTIHSLSFLFPLIASIDYVDVTTKKKREKNSVPYSVTAEQRSSFVDSIGFKSRIGLCYAFHIIIGVGQWNDLFTIFSTSIDDDGNSFTFSAAINAFTN